MVIFWVLLLLALKFGPLSLPGTNLKPKLNNIFDSVDRTTIGDVSGDSEALLLVHDLITTLSLSALQEVLKEMRSILRLQRYRFMDQNDKDDSLDYTQIERIPESKFDLIKSMQAHYSGG